MQFWRGGAGLSLTESARLVDLGVRSLTPSTDYFDAKVRHDETRQWVTARLAAHGIDANALFAILWPDSIKWTYGPLAGRALNKLAGVTHSGAVAPSARLARARQQLVANTARLALEARPVAGWCMRGHQLTDDNRSGEQCRQCRNATYAANRKGISIEAELEQRAAKRERRHAA